MWKGTQGASNTETRETGLWNGVLHEVRMERSQYRAHVSRTRLDGTGFHSHLRTQDWDMISECEWEHVLTHILPPFGLGSMVQPSCPEELNSDLDWETSGRENHMGSPRKHLLHSSRHIEKTEGKGKLICYDFFDILRGAKNKLRTESN